MLEVTSLRERTCVRLLPPACSMCEGHGIGSRHISSVGVCMRVYFLPVKSQRMCTSTDKGSCADQIKIQRRGIASSSDVCTHACRCRLN